MKCPGPPPTTSGPRPPWPPQRGGGHPCGVRPSSSMWRARVLCTYGSHLATDAARSMPFGWHVYDGDNPSEQRTQNAHGRCFAAIRA